MNPPILGCGDEVKKNITFIPHFNSSRLARGQNRKTNLLHISPRTSLVRLARWGSRKIVPAASFWLKRRCRTICGCTRSAVVKWVPWSTKTLTYSDLPPLWTQRYAQTRWLRGGNSWRLLSKKKRLKNIHTRMWPNSVTTLDISKQTHFDISTSQPHVVKIEGRNTYQDIQAYGFKKSDCLGLLVVSPFQGTDHSP